MREIIIISVENDKGLNQGNSMQWEGRTDTIDMGKNRREQDGKKRDSKISKRLKKAMINRTELTDT